MKFKKLEVFGFKSFADKLEVKFGNGITAIVGPNGCGKSNVADAIRWVLGEQSAKLLRGSNMMDVIFNGTEKRKSLSFCEVMLYFDNTEKLFPSMEYNEVVISRKLYRSGESMYFINGNQCRLRDITELLRDGGMGREGYSIIGQGRIDELLSAKPEDRRAIFEEAAGISKFKARKIESERKLVRTRENMVRIDDILAEKAKQLEPLTKQAEAARKYNELYNKLKNDEVNIYIYQHDTANEAKKIISDRMNAVIEETALRQSELDALNEEHRSSMSRYEGLDREVEELREELVRYTVNIEKNAGEMRLQSERMSNLNRTSVELKEENERADEGIKTAEAEMQRNELLLKEKTAQLKVGEKNYLDLRDIYDDITGQLTSGEDEMAAHQKIALDASDRLTEITSNMSGLLVERDALKEKTEDYSRRIGEIESRIASAEENLQSNTVYGNEVASKKEEGERELNELYTKNNEFLYLVNSAATELDKLSSSYHTAHAQFKMLTDIKEAYDAYNMSVKNLLNDAKTNQEISSKIEGVVAQLIRVSPRYETAVETALGNAFQNIITRNEDDTKYLIDYLKATRRGRVTFLPISAGKPRSIESKFLYLLQEKGCLGVASDLIEYDEKYDTVIRGLLGATVFVDNIDTAVAMAKKSGYGFKIVTLDGEVINPSGAYTGGNIKGERNVSNIFTHERELRELTVKVADFKNKIEKVTRERDELAVKQGEVAEKIKSLRELIHNLDIEVASKSEAASTLSLQIDEERKTCIVLKAEFDRCSLRIESIESDINSVGELKEILRRQREEAGENSEEKRKIFDDLRRRREEQHTLMAEAMVANASLKDEIKNIIETIERCKAIVAELNYKKACNEEKLAETLKAMQEIDVILATIATDSSDIDVKKVGEIRQKLSELDELKKSLTANISKLDDKKMEYISILNALSEKRAAEELQLHKVDSDIEYMEQRVREEYGLEYEQCLEFKEEEFNFEKSMTEVNKLKRSISALGTINPDSIEMCKQTYEEYTVLSEQREDLAKAERDLVKIIKDLSGDMLKMFTENFATIRNNFIKIFKELFDGGNADLLLLESEDPLEAGIEIVAQPPQKKLQSISLLSGGERALTAIAILFAILRLKPMPFCVLDEIEAALDDANAGRFAKYLRRFSEETQFIVITHRKPTMELADNLYGVTMEEKGVSKIVSVKLSEAVAQASTDSVSA